MELPRPILDLLERHGVVPSEELRADLEHALSAPRIRTPGPAPHIQTWTDEATTESYADDPGPSSNGAFPDRYQPLGTIGIGGMGQVLRVVDGVLGRTVAMKIAHRELSRAARSRFLAEAQIVAQLQHPGIVAVYDLGELPSGEPYFTMPIVRGRTLGELIREVHAAVGSDGWAPGACGTTFGRLIAAFRAVADAIGYAHARGVVHRDLKPDNVIVGDHGETVVVDWGLAKVLGAPGDFAAERPVLTNRTQEESAGTLVGAVIGTLGYMPPEQARGELERIDERADVHALGATLYEILCGIAPFAAADRFEALTRPGSGPPPRLAAPAPIPDELEALAIHCVQKDPDARPPNGAAVARAVEAWHQGTHRRERALAEVALADRWGAEVVALRERSRACHAEAESRTAALPPHAPEIQKREVWRLQDRAVEAASEADLLEVKQIEVLGAALRTDPDLVEAHLRLGAHWRALHQRTEAAGDDARSAQLLHLVRAHDVTGVHRPYLDGDGAVTVVTDPPGAEIRVYRYEVRDRRRVAVPFTRLGTTPVFAARLPMGSYRLDLVHRDRATVRYPVRIDRCGEWRGVPPGEDTPRPVVLPRRESLGSDDRPVPAGWFVSGGDPLAEWPRPLEPLWVDGFVIRRRPVTNREMLRFLDALVADGQTDEAERHVPRTPDGEPIYGRDPAGRHFLRPDPDGDDWLPDHPVVHVDWHTARAYAGWESTRTGQAWRLPWELEWEKAARGVDGRRFPWGDHFDPAWGCVRSSHRGRPLPQVVTAFPTDLSPYGVEGLAGNVHDWCADLFLPGPPRLATPVEPGDDDVERVLRGGSWHSGERWARAASRGMVRQRTREAVLGFRLVRSCG